MSEQHKNLEKQADHLIENGGEHLLSPEAKNEKAKAIAESKAEHAKLKHEAPRQAVEAAAAQDSSRVKEAFKSSENTPAVASHGFVDRQLKSITLRRELQAIRRKLPAPQRALSRVIHQPVVRAVSEGAAKTVSRPSGLLGGGLLAFLGSTGYYYLTSHYGFTYNYFVMLALFAGGFVLGVVLELLVFAFTSSSRRAE